MKFLTTLMALAICSFSTAAAADLVPAADNIGNITYVGEINGTPFSMEAGDISEVLAAIEAQHPGSLAARAHHAERAPITLNKRNKDGLSCRKDHRGSCLCIDAYTSNLYGAGNILRNIPMSLHVDRNQCARIACIGNDPDNQDGVWLCNDNDYPIDPQSVYIGSYVTDLADMCRDPNNNDLAGGQEFDTDHYNVLARDGCEPFWYQS